MIGWKSIEFLLDISGELKCLRPVQFVFVTQISVIGRINMTESMKWVVEEAGIVGPGMVHSTWRETGTLSCPSFVFNLLFCVVI